MFKVDLDKIIDGITKEVNNEVSRSIDKTLEKEVRKQKEECEDNKQKRNILEYDPSNKRNKKTSVPAVVKIGKGKKRKIIKKSKEKNDDDVVQYFLDKENSIKNTKRTEPPKQNSKTSFEIDVSGKRKIFIDQNLFYGDRTKVEKTNTISTNEIFIDDSLRGRGGSFWSLTDKRKNLSYLSNDEKIVDKFPFTFDFQETFDDDEISDFGRTYQIVGIQAVRNDFIVKKKYLKSLWHSYVLGKTYNGPMKNEDNKKINFIPTVKEDVIFEDHVFDLSVPFLYKNIEKKSIKGGILTAKSDAVYNFMIEDYEKTITKNKNVLENTLPNLYVMMSEMTSENPNPDFSRFISLNNVIDGQTKNLFSFKKKNVDTRNSKVFDLKTNPAGEYFDMFGREYQEAVDNGSIKKLNEKFSNLLFADKDISLLKNFNDKKYLFPLYINLSFTPERTSFLSQTLKDTGLLTTLMTKIVADISANRVSTINTQCIIEEDAENDPNLKVVKFDKMQNRAWDMADVIADIKDNKEILPKNAIFLGNHVQPEVEGENNFKFYRSLMTEIFRSKLQSAIKQKMRTYEEMVSGKEAYSETIFYRVAKFLGDPKGQSPLQNIYIPNVFGSDTIEYIDTQVKYDKKYTYIVYAYRMIIGTKYWYSNLEAESYDEHATFRAYQEPSIKLLEVPFCRLDGLIVDKPPAAPHIEFVAYKGIDNKMLLLFNSNVMSIKEPPVAIEEKDNTIFSKVRQNQQLNDEEPITFGGDDRIEEYEVFKLEEKPSSYADFQGKLAKRVRTDISKATKQKASSGAFIDNLQPNKKYYYVFRAKDVHGHISNPTNVYEVEIINEHGTIFPLVKVVDFKEKIEKLSSKTMKRFIQIVPTVLQGLIDEKASGFENARSAQDVKNKVSLGLSKEKVWGKRFRIKLKSRSTGKIIEFDVNFDHDKTNKIENK